MSNIIAIEYHLAKVEYDGSSKVSKICAAGAWASGVCFRVAEATHSRSGSRLSHSCQHTFIRNVISWLFFLPRLGVTGCDRLLPLVDVPSAAGSPSTGGPGATFTPPSSMLVILSGWRGEANRSGIRRL